MAMAGRPITQGLLEKLRMTALQKTIRHGCPALAALAALTLSASEKLHAAGGQTIIDISFDYAQVRLRPTYDGHVRGSIHHQLVLSADKTISITTPTNPAALVRHGRTRHPPADHSIGVSAVPTN